MPAWNGDDVSAAMELGGDGVLLNTAIARQESCSDGPGHEPRLAGRLPRRPRGRIPKKLYATASSPWDGRINV